MKTKTKSSVNEMPVHPIDLLHDLMVEYSLNQSSLSNLMGIDRQRVYNLFHGARITPELAIRLEKAFNKPGLTALYWLDIQSAFEIHKTNQMYQAELKKLKPFVDNVAIAKQEEKKAARISQKNSIVPAKRAYHKISEYWNKGQESAKKRVKQTVAVSKQSVDKSSARMDKAKASANRTTSNSIGRISQDIRGMRGSNLMKLRKLTSARI
jgi:addiction module HigA family antidote